MSNAEKNPGQSYHTYGSDPSRSASFKALVYAAAALRYSATRKFLFPSSLKAWTSGVKPLMVCYVTRNVGRSRVYETPYE